MAVTEYERNKLFAWFEEHMGKEQATTMMSLLPPVGWGDVATKRDLDILAERVDTKIERVDTKIERLDTKIDTVALRLDTELTGIRAQMATKVDLHEFRADLQRTFVTWILTAQAGVVAALGMLIAFVR